MTTAPERPAIRRRPDWADRSLLPSRAGAQWWVAVCVALVLTTVGVFADIQRFHQLGIVFQACYFLGCLLAVAVVQRKSLFGPMVQPPLILAITVPSVVLLANTVHTKGGATAAALAVGTPLINGFPAMAVTTGAVLAVGIYRLATQRTPATATRPETSRPKTSRPKTGEPRKAEPRKAEPRRSEPRRSEPTRSEQGVKPAGARGSGPDRRPPADRTRQQAAGQDRRTPTDRTRQQAGRPARRPAGDPTTRQPAPRPARQEDQPARRRGTGPASEPGRRTGEQPPPPAGDRVRRRPPRG